MGRWQNVAGAYFGRDLEAMSAAENYHAWLIDRIRPWIGGRCVEVGAGTGNLTQSLAKENFSQLTAVEPSANMFSILCERFDKTSIRTRCSFFQDLVETDRSDLDTVLYLNVLEHVEKDVEELRAVHQSLKPGGVVVVFVPALMFLYSNFDKKIGHFRRYHKEELVSRMRGAGFEIEYSRYMDILGVIPWWVTFRLLGKILVSSQVQLYDRIGVPITRKIESIVAPPIGKNLLVIGRRIG